MKIEVIVQENLKWKYMKKNKNCKVKTIKKYEYMSERKENMRIRKEKY